MNVKTKNKHGNARLFLLFALPAVFIWFSVVVLPFFYGVGITFTDWDGMSMEINFIGLANYYEVFTDPTFLTSLLKTVVFVVASVVLSNVLALALVSAWQMSGYLMVIYIAGLTNVPGELKEAALIDGASYIQMTRYVTLPLIRNTIAICVFLSITRAFMSFDLNLSLTAGGPYKSTELIAYKIYQTAFTSMEYGKGQAQALVLFVIVAIVALLQVYFTKKGSVEES